MSTTQHNLAGSLIMNFLLADFFQTDQVSHHLLILRLTNETPTDEKLGWKFWVPESQPVLKWMQMMKSNHFLLLIEEILHQLRSVVYPTIYKALNIPGGAKDFFHQLYVKNFGSSSNW